ncbi:MAG: glycosyl transferase family 2 [Acidobacteriaceae bacterium]|nr:glycosyl transferase family 2 [Acidobacteriaceae bacterium]
MSGAASPLISIVTPSLNQAAFLGEALKSVRTQQYPAYEHIVLDGGSTDGTSELLQRYSECAGGTRLAWRSHPDEGQSAALNEGFLQARGDIIGWLNADDRYRFGCFEYVAQAFARNPGIDILYGDYTFIDPAGCQLSLRREIEFSHFILKYHRVLYIPTTATFFRRRIFEEHNFLRKDLHFVMDLEFFLRLAEAGYRFHHLPRVLADFRIHPSAKSVKFVDRQRAEHRRVVLESTPLASYLPIMPLRQTAATLLQIPAAILRHSEKLLRGFYFNDRCASHFLLEQIRGVDVP